MAQVTGKVTWKRYKCVDCGHERSASTNHYGEIYDRCPKCSWKPGQGLRHECLEPLPEGWEMPEKWQKVKLGQGVLDLRDPRCIADAGVKLRGKS